MTKKINEIIAKISPHYALKKKLGKDVPVAVHKLAYDSATDTLEPLYFWILDYMNKSFGKVEKIVDNFASSPGSGHFSELRGKATQMQEQASRILATINTILKSVINLIYDLKEFKIRLSHYEEARSSNKDKAESGILALKQIWMDKVDIQRGQGSINAMSAGDLNFVTLRDAFLRAKSVEDVKNLDLNERVLRILKARLQEFFEWRKRSEQELKKRFEIEKAYLKSQVDAMKLQARWAKPYLRAAEKLTESENLQSDAALVTAFNTIMLELTLMGINEINPKAESVGDYRLLPQSYGNDYFLKRLRKYSSVVFVDFNFRGIPSKVGQHYVFGGRADVLFTSYGLNNEELALFKEEQSKSDFEDALKLVEGMTEDSLRQLNLDIDELLGSEDLEEKENSDNTNPFSALFSFAKPAEKSKSDKDKEKEKLKKLKEKGIKPDTFAEKYLRNLAEANSFGEGFNIYDFYKKGHGMASVPYGGDKGDAKLKLKAPMTALGKFFRTER